MNNSISTWFVSAASWPLLLLLLWSLPHGAVSEARDEGALAGLREQLGSSQKRTRRSALKGLVQLDSQAGWELVVGALGDNTGEVADGAQWLLGGLSSAAELELVMGKHGLRSKSPWVRRRVLELFARVQTPVPAKALMRGLKDRDGEVRRMAAWSLERLARAGRVDHLRGTRSGRDLGAKLASLAGGERDKRLRGRALRALAAWDEEAARRLWPSFMKARGLGLRCVALGLARELLPAEQALEVLSQAAMGKSRLLRGQAQESLGRLGNRAAMACLIECLPVEEDARLLFLLVRRLQAMSGVLYRKDVRPWRDWLAAQPESWRAQDGKHNGGRGSSKQAAHVSSAAGFSGLRLRSKRLTFLIDLSGSMWTEGADGQTPKQLVERKLEEALGGLSRDTRFNVIPYTGKPHAWSKELKPATPRNLQRALDYFVSCKQRGSGNFWGAAMLALEDPELDTLVVLSDGAPSGGKRHELELILSHFEELNLTRRVAVDSVLVDSSWRLEAYWRRLARGTGGESISVAFP